MRELYVEKGLEVAETALALDASYHGGLRGLRDRGWLRPREGPVPPTKLRHGRLLHKVWQSMRERCLSEAHPEYEKVGGLGIRVCAAWQDFGAFHAWAMRSGYHPGLCLTRLDRGRDYEPRNCRWMTRAEVVSRAPRTVSRKPRWTITAFGETKGPYAWSRERRCAVSLTGLVDRLRGGWRPEEAILTPSTTGPKGPLIWVTAFGETKGVEDWVRDRRCRVDPRACACGCGGACRRRWRSARRRSARRRPGGEAVVEGSDRGRATTGRRPPAKPVALPAFPLAPGRDQAHGEQASTGCKDNDSAPLPM